MIEVGVLSAWSIDQKSTKYVHPASALLRLLDWKVTPWPVDAEVPPPLAAALAQALVKLGQTAFRWGYPETPALAEGDLLHPAPRGLFRHSAVAIVETARAELAAKAFEWQWDMQGQVVWASERGCRLTPDQIRRLSTCTDWRDFTLTAPLRLFMAPVADGVGALIACREESDWLEFSEALSESLAASGIAYRPA
jgi:hypothetical protein